jgi:hypothetical protein
MNEEIIRLQDRINKLELDLAHAQENVTVRDMAINNRDEIIANHELSNKRLEAKLEQMRVIQKNSIDTLIEDKVISMVHAAIEDFDFERIIQEGVSDSLNDITAEDINGLETLIDGAIHEFFANNRFDISAR